MVFKKENPCNRVAFEKICSYLRERYPANVYTIEDIWMDYGRGIKWETIVCYRPKTDSRYQVLNPNRWESIHDYAEHPQSLQHIARDIMIEQESLLH